MQNIFNLLLFSVCFVLIYQHLVPGFSNGAVGFKAVGFHRKLFFGCFMYFVTSLIESVRMFSQAIWHVATFISNTFDPDVQVHSLETLLARPLIVQVAVWLSTLLAGLVMPGTIAVPNAGSAWQAAYASSLLVLGFYLFSFYRYLLPGALNSFMY